MAMHRRHNPAAGGGGANPFTGRSLPAGRSAGGGGYHGNSPSLVPMAKKAVALLLTFVIFFYVIFAPEYDDGSYEANRQPSIKKKESASDAMNTSFVDLSKKPQTEPVKLNLPSEITPDPNDNNEVEREEEKQVESPDYEDQRIGDKEEEEEQGMAYDSNDPDEQSKKSIGEDNESNDEDNTAEAESQLSPAEKIYGAHMHADETEPGSEDHSQSDPFLGLGDESEEKEDEEAALDNSRGGLRGSKSANNKDPFGRQETTDDDEKKEDEEEEQVVESSQDDPENVIAETFYKNQSPLEVPNTVVEDVSIKSNHTKSMADAIDEYGTDIVAVIKPCQDDPDFRYKGHEEHNCEYVSEREKCDKLHSGEKIGIESCPVSCNMVDECLASLQEQEGSHVATKKNETNAVVRTFDEEEKFSSKEKAAFEAKYGSALKSMEEEVNEQVALENGEFNNQAPLEIPVVDVSDVIELNQTEVAQSMKNSSGFSMEEDVDKQLKSMADEVEMEDKGSNDEDLKTKKTEDSGDDSKTVKKGLSDSHKVNTTTNDFDAEEENESNDEDVYEASKAKQDTSEVVVDTDGDSKVNKTASLVEENFKEYLITNSEDEPNKNEKNSEDRKPSLDKNKDDEATVIVKDDIISKDDGAKEEGKAEDHDETVQNNGSQDDSEQGEGADEDSKDKKTGVDKESVSVKGKIKDTDELLKNSEGSNDALEQGEVADEVSKDKRTAVDRESKKDSQEVDEDLVDNEALESPIEVLASEVDKNKESVAADEEKAVDADELLKNSGDESNDALEQGEDEDEDDEAEKTSSIRGAIGKQSKNDSQEVGKDFDLSSPKGGKASKDDKKEELVVEEEGEAEDPDETVKNKRSTDTLEKVDKVVKDSKAKKTKSIRGATDEKSSKATQNTGSTFEEGKQTAEVGFVKRSGDSSVQGDDADEESKHKSIDSKDESQEVNSDLGNSQVLSNIGNETTSQIDKSKSKGASESVGRAKGNGDDKEEGGDDVESKRKKVASIGSSLGDSIKEIDAVKDTEHIKTDPEDSADNKASKLGESEEKAGESTAQNEDQESSDNLVGASRDKKYGESGVSKKVKNDIKYAKIASGSKKPAAKKDASDKETGEKGKARGSKIEDSPVGKDEKVIPILGDLGEAIKESDAAGSDEEAATEKNDLGEAVKESDAPAIDEEAATDKKDGVRSSKDDKSVSPKENDEEVKEVAKGKDKTAKKDRKRKEKK